MKRAEAYHAGEEPLHELSACDIDDTINDMDMAVPWQGEERIQLDMTATSRWAEGTA